MAVASPSSTETLDPNSDASNPPSTAPSDHAPAAVSTSAPFETPAANASVPIPNPAPVAPLLPAVPSFAPSFRPLGVAPVPHYSAVPTPMAPNPSFQAPFGQAPGIQPPGVSAPPSVMPPGSYPTMRPGAPYQVAPGQPPMAAPMPYGQVGNGYATVPPPQAPMGIPPGMPRYPSPYPAMIRPGFPMRPMLPTGMVPQLPRPPLPSIRGVPPVMTPVIRPVIPLVAPAEKPQTTVYVGKIAATVENEFLLSVLTLCGPVKSWKRAQDPSDGKPKGFGFCEYETAEGVLRALRLLSKLNIDGQELVVNIKQATREYLERYVEKKKTEKEKLKEAESGGPAKENDSKEDSENQELAKSVAEETEKESEDSGVKENQESYKKFGIVTDEDREADRDALEKLTGMIEERTKNKPLPPPVPLDGSAKSISEVPSKSRDGDSDVDIMRSDAAEDKIDEETTSENKPATESDKPETGSPDRSRRHDSRNKERDRDRDSKREKERELERVERDRERDRVRRERDREMKLREAERLYKERLKEWEAREREKEHHRQYEKDREKERERERRKEIMRQEEESSDEDADDSRKKRRRSSFLEERKKKRKREKEEDLEDRLKEEEEVVDAKRRAAEEQQLKADLKSLGQVSLDYENPTAQEERSVEDKQEKQSVPDQAKEVSANGINNVDVISRDNSADDLIIAPVATSDTKQSNAPARKLGFGLIGSGKRTTVPSVFHEEDDAEDDEKKMRPLVPIDYSTEELQAVQTSASGPQANLAAAAEFAKRISGINTKEEKSDVDRENRERSRRSTDKLNFRERDRNDDESNRHREESREKIHDRNVDKEKGRDDKPKTENKKLLDAKQLIDMIPKTKEELFVYEINWDVYDKHQLHERMRPWISKKITEFLGEEEPTLVDYIVTCIKDHVQASTMLEMLQSILDDEAEMFVLKMWRMLIFEIKKVETGLAIKSKS